jgi:glycosyltransferase involved in cell wall biosynthesis
LWDARDDTVVVLCVSRLASEKNMTLLWRAFEAIQRRGIDARLVLVGDGPQRSQLQSLCRGAHFAGVRRGEDLAAHYASADLFVFPSLTETFGNVVPEAMASALPVLAFDHAAAGLLVRHRHNGWLAPVSDAAQFVELAVAAAADRVALRVAGAQARRTALTLDWQRVVDDLEAVLRRAVAPLQPTQSPLSWRPLST